MRMGETITTQMFAQCKRKESLMARFRVFLVATCLWFPIIVFAQTPAREFHPVVVQGAMPSETARFASRLENVTQEQIGGWRFWRGRINGYPVILSRTLKGIANAAAATAIAAERFHPVAIINQGTAGGLDTSLHLFDVILGTSAVSVGAFKTPHRFSGEGSNSLEWKPLNLMASEGSAGNDPQKQTLARFAGDSLLLEVARRATTLYKNGRVVEGVIGSSDMWNDEIDRIARLHNEFGISVEEMETASAAQVAGLFRIPFLGIRVVSDNTTNGEAYHPNVGEACQDFVYEVVRAYVAHLVAKHPRN